MSVNVTIAASRFRYTSDCNRAEWTAMMLLYGTLSTTPKRKPGTLRYPASLPTPTPHPQSSITDTRDGYVPAVNPGLPAPCNEKETPFVDNDQCMYFLFPDWSINDGFLHVERVILNGVNKIVKKKN